MKVKTSITLSQDLLEALEPYLERNGTRSEFIESALWAFLAQLERNARAERDKLIIAEHLTELNSEADDALRYQVST